jgi:hypothetical protein
VITSHGDAGRARAAARELVAGGVRAILSFGPAVGLAPLLRPGDLVIAECVVMPQGESIATDLAWRSALEQRLSALSSVTVARLAGRDRLAASAEEKRTLFRATFAAAQDSESHAIAAVAQAAGLPFVAVRAIADPAEENRPAYPARNAYGASLAAWLRPWELRHCGAWQGTAGPRSRPCARSQSWDPGPTPRVVEPCLPSPDAPRRSVSATVARTGAMGIRCGVSQFRGCPRNCKRRACIRKPLARPSGGTAGKGDDGQRPASQETGRRLRNQGIGVITS